MFRTSTNLKEFPADKSRRKRWPLISGGFIKQKVAAKVCNKHLSGGFKNHRKCSFQAIFSAFPAIFGRRK
jgi:hypothetical protein